MEESSSSPWILALSIAIGAAIIGAVFFFTWRKLRLKLITYVQHFIRDTSGRYLHIFGAERIMPEDGDSFDIWHHRIFDLQKLVFYAGESLKGKDLELDSPYVKRSLEKLSAAVGFRLSLGEVAEDIDDQADPEDDDQYSLRASRIALFYQDHLPSETEKPRRFPDQCIVVTQHSSEPERFSITLRKNGAESARHMVPGDPDYFGKVLWLDPEPWVAMTYRRVLTTRSGMALLIMNHETGALVFNNFIVATTGKPNTAVQR